MLEADDAALSNLVDELLNSDATYEELELNQEVTPSGNSRY